MALMKFDNQKPVGEIIITFTQSFTAEDIENIVVTALEGGIGYWAQLQDVGPEWDLMPRNAAVSQWCTKLLLDGHMLRFKDVEEEDPDVWELTLAKLMEGVKRTIQLLAKPGLENMDATTADCIVQYALFGEVVYG